MLGRRKFVVFVVRFPGYWPSRAAERVQEIVLVLSQWKPFSGLIWWELLKLCAEGSSVGDGMCRVIDCIHVLIEAYDASQEGKSVLFLEKARCLLSLREWIRGFHELLRKNPSFQFMFFWVQLICIATWSRQTKGLIGLLTSRCHSIQFIFQTETYDHLLLDLNIYRSNEGSLDQKMYRKLAHTSLCLNVSSHHHPTNEYSLLSTKVYRFRVICNQQSVQDKHYTPQTFWNNGFNYKQF